MTFTLRAKTAAFAALAIIVVSATIAVVISGVIASAKRGEIIDNAIEVCEDIKHDRLDNARGWTEVERYMDLVEDAAPSKEIRVQAADTRVIVGESANQLRTRLWVCEARVRDGEKVIDDRALREALGEL